jgi:enoyl-[acyl-carrier protein] reductase III
VSELSTLGLEGKVALVTGAARGLGRAIAHKLCASGCHVLVNYASSDAAAAATVESFAGLKGTASLLKGDVRDPRTVADLLDTVERDHGRLDVFVHNAATFRPMMAVRPDPEAFASEQALALNPLLHGAGRLIKLMAGGGRIVAISSNGASSVIPAYLGVGVAKAALENLVRYLAVELAPHGIAVNTVATAMLDKGEGTANAEVMGILAARTPAGRLSTPADVADAVALLCTAEAGWIQGQTLMVDGGLGLRA